MRIAINMNGTRFQHPSTTSTSTCHHNGYSMAARTRLAWLVAVELKSVREPTMM